MRRAGRIVLVLIVLSCAHNKAYNDGTRPRESDYRPPEVIVRNTSWEDPELAAKGLGRMEVSVRAADRPAQAIQQALVRAKREGTEGPWKQVLTNERGVAVFDSIVVGRYELWVRAIGYGGARSDAVVSPGCRTDVEAYIGISAMGIAPPPPEPGRMRVTTCRTPK